MTTVVPSAARRERHSLGLSGIAPGLAGLTALLLVLVVGGLWFHGHATLERELESSELRGDLHEAHTSLLGARIDLYEHDYFSAGRRLEGARALLRRAEERSRLRGWQVEVSQHDLTSFEADISEAQRLLDRLGQEESGSGIRGPDVRK